MNELETWIEHAITASGARVKRVEMNVARDIVKKGRSLFVEGDPRVWSLSLKKPFEIYSTSDAELSDIIPEKQGWCWLIAASDEDEPVYKLPIEDTEALLAECPFFEYYLLAEDFKWLVIESDHNQFFVKMNAVE